MQLTEYFILDSYLILCVYYTIFFNTGGNFQMITELSDKIKDK